MIIILMSVIDVMFLTRTLWERKLRCVLGTRLHWANFYAMFGFCDALLMDIAILSEEYLHV